MIASIHTTAPILTLANRDDARDCRPFELTEFQWVSPANQSFARQTGDLSVLVPRLFQLNLSSLGAYIEIADCTTDPELRGFAKVMVQQRMAQCRALSRLSAVTPPQLANPAVCELRFTWLRALWNLEQENRIAFVEIADYAESLLEDAFVTAADAVIDQPVADLLYELAINVCGARERFEELAAQFETQTAD